MEKYFIKILFPTNFHNQDSKKVHLCKKVKKATVHLEDVKVTLLLRGF